MKKMWLVAVAFSLWSSGMLPAAAGDLSGSWVGPWYRGMTSGTMTLRIESDGSGMIQMINLDNFTEEEVELYKVKQSADSFGFSASGGGHGVFVANTQLSGDGATLDGKGEYEGFPIKFKLKRR